jgi:hypothetical protein
VLSRIACFLFVSLAFTAAACGNDDPDVERRGGTIPDPQGDGGDEATGAGGASELGAPVPFCDALKVIRDKCQRCHGNPLQNGAPAAFLTYEDTQKLYPNSDMTWADVMLPAVEKDIMPFVALNEASKPIMPPVEPLTAEEKTTLVTWLKQGAEPEGGTDCP